MTLVELQYPQRCDSVVFMKPTGSFRHAYVMYGTNMCPNYSGECPL
jgi:hypothetical protein